MSRALRVRRVAIIGTGLIGTSIGLALRRRAVDVTLSDSDPEPVRLAEQLGAGSAMRPGMPRADVAVLAVPPQAVAGTLLDAQRRGLADVFTDVASVKARPLDDALASGCDLRTYVPGHPIAGSERSGPTAARPGLFAGKPWALCPTARTAAGLVSTVTRLVRLCGGEPVLVDAAQHDRAMVAVSHIPHVTASVTAARLLDADHGSLRLAGTGLSDVIRTAGGDPVLWTDILTAHPLAIADAAFEMADEFTNLGHALRAVAAGSDSGVRAVADLLRRGRAGRGRLTGDNTAAAHPAAYPYLVADRAVGSNRRHDAAHNGVPQVIGVNQGME